MTIRRNELYTQKKNICEYNEKIFLITGLNGLKNILFFVLQVILKEKVKELNLHEVSYLIRILIFLSYFLIEVVYSGMVKHLYFQKLKKSRFILIHVIEYLRVRSHKNELCEDFIFLLGMVPV